MFLSEGRGHNVLYHSIAQTCWLLDLILKLLTLNVICRKALLSRVSLLWSQRSCPTTWLLVDHAVLSPSEGGVGLRVESVKDDQPPPLGGGRRLQL